MADKRSAAESKDAAASEKTLKRRRRFPYRKVHDLEQDILLGESRVEELHMALSSPEVLRDGVRVKSLKLELDQQQQALKNLYEHLDEAIELN